MWMTKKNYNAFLKIYVAYATTTTHGSKLGYVQALDFIGVEGHLTCLYSRCQLQGKVADRTPYYVKGENGHLAWSDEDGEETIGWS